MGGSDPRLNWWLMSNAVMTLASAAVPRTRFSNGIFCNIAVFQITHPNSNICFNMDASRELEVTGNFPLLRLFGHRYSGVGNREETSQGRKGTMGAGVRFGRPPSLSPFQKAEARRRRDTGVRIYNGHVTMRHILANAHRAEDSPCRSHRLGTTCFVFLRSAVKRQYASVPLMAGAKRLPNFLSRSEASRTSSGEKHEGPQPH